MARRGACALAPRRTWAWRRVTHIQGGSVFRQRCAILGVVSFVIVALLPESSFAQSGIIAGSVKDISCGVMPGVTVEAASPALIEKVRSAVTDGGGEYKIVDLRPGTYTVTFTLAGFSTVKREGIELIAGVTAVVPRQAIQPRAAHDSLGRVPLLTSLPSPTSPESSPVEVST